MVESLTIYIECGCSSWSNDFDNPVVLKHLTHRAYNCVDDNALSSSAPTIYDHTERLEGSEIIAVNPLMDLIHYCCNNYLLIIIKVVQLIIAVVVLFR